MKTLNDQVVAAEASVDPQRWQDGFEELLSRFACRFARVEPRRRARDFLLGLLAGLPRANCWSIAEHAGQASPDGMQHLLARAVWDEDAVVDDLRGYVVEHLGEPGAVLVIDETGDVKKGNLTVGVQRQYTGTAGRVENAQVAVYLAYASTRGHAFIDRALYLPRSWAADDDRRAAAGVPVQVEFATKPALAGRMITRAVQAGTPASWVAGDEVYGSDPGLRAQIVGHGLGYVLAIAKDHRIATGVGAYRADELAARLPRNAWQRHSAGRGAKGQRWYDWALVDTVDPAADPHHTGHHWLLIRRNRRTGELAFYRAYSPTAVPLAVLVRVAGTRWKIEEAFQSGKELAALDEHQVRRWRSWHRWTVLAMLAHAFLSVMAAHATRSAKRPNHEGADEAGLNPLTRNEIRRLFVALLTHPAHTAHHILHWSRWRRRHQTRAQASHYRKQAATDQ